MWYICRKIRVDLHHKNIKLINYVRKNQELFRAGT